MTRVPRLPTLLLSTFGAMVLAVGPGQAQYQVLDGEQTDAPASNYWSVEVVEGQLSLSGAVPFPSVADALNARAGSDDALDIDDGAPRGFLPDALIAITAADLLRDGFVGYGESGWRITGTLEDDAELANLLQIVAAPTGTGEPWIVDLFTADDADIASSAGISTQTRDGIESLLEAGSDDAAEPGEPEAQSAIVSDEPLPETPLDVEPEAPLADANADPVADESVEPAAASEPDEAAIDVCRQGVAALLDDRSVLFSSGSARLTADSLALVRDIGAVLADCPETPVYVEGHTDSDGGDRANLVLSLSRAEAVVDALVETGLLPRRLYAVGYGAGLPIASNDTAAGKAQNRRIVFNFEDIAEQDEVMP